MKTIISEQRLIHVFIVILLLSSCTSDKLSRGQAEVLIKEFYNYPNVETKDFNLSDATGNPLHTLVNQNYLNLHTSSIYRHQYTVTQEGKTYLKGKKSIATNLRDFNDVTGIMFHGENETKAKVEFTCKRYAITPFGKTSNYKDGDVTNYSTEFAKYDDGWRIVSKKNKNYKPKDFPKISEFGIVDLGLNLNKKKPPAIKFITKPKKITKDIEEPYLYLQVGKEEIEISLWGKTSSENMVGYNIKNEQHKSNWQSNEECIVGAEYCYQVNCTYYCVVLRDDKIEVMEESSGREGLKVSTEKIIK